MKLKQFFTIAFAIMALVGFVRCKNHWRIKTKAVDDHYTVSLIPWVMVFLETWCGHFGDG